MGMDMNKDMKIVKVSDDKVTPMTSTTESNYSRVKALIDAHRQLIKSNIRGLSADTKFQICRDQVMRWQELMASFNSEGNVASSVNSNVPRASIDINDERLPSVEISRGVHRDSQV